MNNSVDISQQFLKQFEEDSFYIHQNGYLQFLGKPLQLNHGIYEYGLIPYFLKGFNKNTPVYGLRSQGVLGEPDAILINNNQCYTIQAKT